MSATLRPTRVEELADAVRTESARGAGASPFVLVSGGSWLPSSAHGARLELAAFRGVREYAPADLTISVGAATTLAELDAATRQNKQCCPLQSWGDDSATVGAVIATATTGPFADALGRPRDLVLGLECVDGRGRLVRAGGRVVKNVAGFDLTRLMTGAWGTLGAITEVHLRLRALPAMDVTLALTGGSDVDARVRDVARGPFAPLALVAVSEANARTLALPSGARWLVRLGGNDALAKAARAAFAAVAGVEEMGAEIWARVRRECAPPSPLTRWRTTALAERVRAAFDPARVLNRGVLPVVAQ